MLESKVAQFSTKLPSPTQSSKCSLIWNVNFFKIALKVTKYLGNFCHKICCRIFQNSTIWSHCSSLKSSLSLSRFLETTVLVRSSDVGIFEIFAFHRFTRKKNKRRNALRQLGIVKSCWLLGSSGCGSVGRTVASDTRGPWFESRHQQKFYRTFIYCQLDCIEKTKRKQKSGREWPI